MSLKLKVFYCLIFLQIIQLSVQHNKLFLGENFSRNNSVDDSLEAKMRRKAEQAAKKQAKFEERMKLEKHQVIFTL